MWNRKFAKYELIEKQKTSDTKFVSENCMNSLKIPTARATGLCYATLQLHTYWYIHSGRNFQNLSNNYESFLPLFNEKSESIMYLHNNFSAKY